ncbi:MAG: MurR/RpiR family transcriptional regulator [Lactobacillus sp.]|jgi:DNA-binding MurR/RpiR family transcriptional regulator|uniref:MurR/RpiR family transcriptional regulator n=1 Tax=Lacticaseibacillus suilingensis TaxID=2799577 RepID=A0ABW4BGI4_9LACO|nr:MurR/RpiR family transcriptional regulator [Lacticaseibacillus suilingensis]MCI1894264.1 MurR/RpiR family transcriptional regulator [Lactobacillus sp.]MCI1916891.1 MurR/RpiR family transcriptional regulator [Lactobacillus sp.]MCI1942095.1 MurR/RpiR family transcriptional regulator [Lactobacillus sp.]MCI1972442.1 MurR/RpiR family transcriptional regulator [Lactobacillus sp.]MCI2017027.1 MurR/RpiR family transcriptional regulator [Lactobacillus sp.]
MLLQEKMQRTQFSANEQLIVDFILSKEDQIKSFGTPQIAQATYTSPSVVVRVAKKLGFNGWRELKASFLAEVEYLQSNFQNLDANMPFTEQDSAMTIAGKITQLEVESAKDTLALVDHDSLQKALRIMQTHRTVNLLTLSNLNFMAEEFVFKLRHIGKSATVFPIQNTMFQEAAMMTQDDCVVCLSYSGESDPLFQALGYLKTNHVPIIAVTSIGENHLSRLADVTLHVTTREKAYSKIGSFSSLTSMSLLLDILYSCYFALGYQQNLAFKKQLSALTEIRPIDNHIIED